MNFSDLIGGSVSEPNLTGLGTLTNTALNTAYNFSTDNPGQMADCSFPVRRDGHGTTGGRQHFGHAVSVTSSSGTNHSAPGTIQPNTGNAGDSNLATALIYSPFLAVTTAIAPNSGDSHDDLRFDRTGNVDAGSEPYHRWVGSGSDDDVQLCFRDHGRRDDCERGLHDDGNRQHALDHGGSRRIRQNGDADQRLWDDEPDDGVDGRYSIWPLRVFAGREDGEDFAALYVRAGQTHGLHTRTIFWDGR